MCRGGYLLLTNVESVAYEAAAHLVRCYACFQNPDVVNTPTHHGVQHVGDVALGLIEGAIATTSPLTAVNSLEARPEQLELLGWALTFQHTHRQCSIPQQIDDLQAGYDRSPSRHKGCPSRLMLYDINHVTISPKHSCIKHVICLAADSPTWPLPSSY